VGSFIFCPKCKRKLKVPETMAGKSFRCPACKNVISTLSEPDTPPPSCAVKTALSSPTAPVPSRSRLPQDEEREEIIEPTDEAPVRERPRKKRPKRKKSSTGLIIGLAVGGAVLLLLLLGTGGVLLVQFLRNRTDSATEWQTFTPPGDDCAILLPGMPVPQTQTMLDFRGTQFTVERKNGKEAFGIAIFDVPPRLLRPNFSEELANVYCKGVLDGMGGGQDTRNTPIALGDVPGREFQGKLTARRGTLIGRVYLAKVGKMHRAYLLAVFGEAIQPNTGDVVRFLDSFRFTAPAAAPDFSGAAAAEGMQPPPAFNPPPANPWPNPPQPNPGFRPPRVPRRPF
jgi:hypothetical protein